MFGYSHLGRQTLVFHEKTAYQKEAKTYSANWQNKKELDDGEPPKTKTESVREGFPYTSTL